MSILDTEIAVLEVKQETIDTPFEVGHRGDYNATKLVFPDLVGTGYSVLVWKPRSMVCLVIPLVNNEWILGNEVLSNSGLMYAQVVKKDESNNFIKHSQVFKLLVNESAPCTQEDFETVPPNFKIAYDEMVAVTKKVNDALLNGDFNGLSAYEIAVKNGFKGTEAEWIESLKYWNSPEFTKLANQVRADKNHVDTVVSEFDKNAYQIITNFENKVTDANTDFDNKISNANTSFKELVNKANTDLVAKVNKINEDLDTKVTQINSDLDAKETAINQALDAKIDGANSVIDAKVQESVTSAESAKQSELKAQSIADNMQGLTNAFRIDTNEQGRVITATDSADSVINGLKVFGESTQVQSTGAQCISAETPAIKVQNGIIFEPISESKIKVFGTASETAEITTDLFNLEAGEYTLSCNYATQNNCRILLMNRKGVPFLDLSTNPNATERTGTIEGAEYKLLIRINKGKSVDNTFEIMLAKGNKALPYEPYTNGLATPTPETPSEILSKTINEIMVTSKNLFDINKIKTKYDEVNGGIINNGDGSLFIKNNSKSSGISVYLTLQDLCPALKSGDIIIFNYKNSNFINHCAMYLYESKISIKGKEAFLVEDKYLSSTVYLYPSGNANTSATLSEIQFEYGATVTAYAPFSEPQIVALTKPVMLNGIEATNGGNVTIDGKQYASDVITQKDGIYGVERMTAFEKASDDMTLYFYGNNNNNIDSFYIASKYKIKGIINNAFCNLLPYNSSSAANISMESVRITEPNVWFRFNSSRFNGDIEACKKYLIDNHAEVVYPMLSNTFEPLPEADQQALKALKSNYPTTVVVNNDNAFMQLDYVADTKNYIDNRLSEIKTALIASKGV